MALAERPAPALSQSPAWITNAALLLFGCIYLELTRTGTHEFHHFVHGFSEGVFGQLVLYLGAIALIERSPTDRWTLPIILIIAVAARLIAVFEPPFLSTDVYRYVWDGKVQAAGINPFRYIPADGHLAFLRDTHIYPFINRRGYAHTIYPPGSQILYLLAARVYPSVPVMKLIMVGFEAATCFALAAAMRLLGLPRERLLLYAWHPVCVWEIASSGHVDAAALTAIALALVARLKGQPLAATGWLGAATLIKLYPAALLPALVRRRVLAPLLLFAGILVAGYLPYLSVGRGVFGFLPAYAAEEGLNTGTRYFPLALFERTFHIAMAPPVYILACAVLLAGFAAWAWRRGMAPAASIRSGLVLAAVLNLCFSPHYPWYFLWLLPFLTLWPWRPAFYLVLGVTYMLATRLGMPGEPIYRMNSYLYGGFFLLLVLDWGEGSIERWRQRTTSAQPLAAERSAQTRTVPGTHAFPNQPRISVIIPALNEEATIAGVVQEMPRNLLRECIVVDNGSRDATAARAQTAGARVVREPRRGYGRACARGAAAAHPASDVLVFLDGDGSDVPAEIAAVAAPVLEGRYDFVVGSRLRGRREPGSLLASQIFAGRLAGLAMRLLYGVRYTDMGPMRAIARSTLAELGMTEMTYGWNLEMQMKAASRGLRILELPTTCRCRRGGVSKVAGSLQGSVKAAYRITQVLLRIALTQRRR